MRETWRIAGEREVTAASYTSGFVWPDAIGYSFYPIDIHQPDSIEIDIRPLARGVVATIPYGALVPAGSDHLLVAGRSIAGDQAANSAYRVQATCMATGQAAGAAPRWRRRGRARCARSIRRYYERPSRRTGRSCPRSQKSDHLRRPGEGVALVAREHEATGGGPAPEEHDSARRGPQAPTGPPRTASPSTPEVDAAPPARCGGQAGTAVGAHLSGVDLDAVRGRAAAGQRPCPRNLVLLGRYLCSGHCPRKTVLHGRFTCSGLCLFRFRS